MSISSISVNPYGSATFEKINLNLAEAGRRKAAQGWHEAKEVYKSSPFGNDTKLGTSRFQQSNKEAEQLANRSIAKSARAAKEIYMSSPFGNDTKVGTSAFQQANKRIVQTAQQHTPSVLQQAKAAYIRQVQNAAEAAKNPTRNTKIDVGA